MDDNTKTLLKLIEFASRQDMEVFSITQDFDAITGEQLRKILRDFVSGIGTERDTLRARIAELEAIVSAPRGTDAQILKERGLTCDAALGAIIFGGNGSEPPPDAAAWLRPFYNMGQRLTELESMRSAVGAGGVGQPVKPAPAIPDSLRIDAIWQEFCETDVFHACLQYVRVNAHLCALYTAFRAGAAVKTSAPSPQEEPPQPKDDDVKEGSWDHLRLMMETSAWDGKLELSDALANINDFAAIQPTQDADSRNAEGKLPIMKEAFRSITSGNVTYWMSFYFPSLETLQAADDEWRKFAAIQAKGEQA